MFKEYVISILNEFGYETYNIIFINTWENNANIEGIDTDSKEITIICCFTLENKLRTKIISLIKEKNLTLEDKITFKR